MDLQTITDIQELKALRGDEYQRREDASGVVRQTEQNIVLLNQRIIALLGDQASEAKKDKPTDK